MMLFPIPIPHTECIREHLSIPNPLFYHVFYQIPKPCIYTDSIISGNIFSRYILKMKWKYLVTYMKGCIEQSDSIREFKKVLLTTNSEKSSRISDANNRFLVKQ